MKTRVLVAFATKHGSTAEIARRIGSVLVREGLDADVLEVHGAVDPAAYDAVVLGSAVYVGGWRREAARFLKRHEQVLGRRPLWLFSSGPTGEGEAAVLTKGWRVPAALEAVVERLRPRDVVVFHGVLDEARLNRFERWIVARVGAPRGDYRDVAAIDAWAQGIAQALKEAVPTAA